MSALLPAVVEPGRFELHRSPVAPDAHRAEILLRLAGLADAIPVLGLPRGPGPSVVLREAEAGTVVCEDAAAVGAELAQRAGLLPPDLAGPVEELGALVRTGLVARLARATVDAGTAREVRGVLRTLDRQLRAGTYLLGGELTDADVRLWVQVVRLDAGANAHGRIGPTVDAYAGLWRWARELHARPAFAASTDFTAFTAPFAALPPWDDRPTGPADASGNVTAPAA